MSISRISIDAPRREIPPALTEASTFGASQVAGDWRSRLGNDVPRTLGHWFATRPSTIVKDGTHRTVYRLDVSERPLFVKHYHAQGMFRRWLGPFRTSSAKSEWSHNERAARCGIDAPHAVAWLEIARGPRRGESFLVSESLDDCVSLDEAEARLGRSVSRRAQSRLRRLLMRSLIRTVALAHRFGLEHGDLHAGNLLVRQAELTAATREPPRLFMIDLAHARWGRPLSATRARAALIDLVASFRHVCSPRLIRIALAEYARLRPELAMPSDAAWIDCIARDAKRRSASIARRRDRRALADNRNYRQLRTIHGSASFVAEFDSQHVAQWLADPERLIRGALHAPLKLGGSSLVVKAELPSAIGQPARPIVCKRIRTRHWLKRWNGWWARRRARHAWIVATGLLARGLPVARPLALLQPRGGESAYLLSEWVPGAVNLHLYAWELARLDPRARHAAAARVALELGRLVSALHGWGISHRDLKGCNLMVVDAEGRLELPLVDLDGLQICRRVSHRERVQNLARLASSLRMHSWISKSQGARFLRAYARELGLDRAERHALWSDLARATQRVARKRARRDSVAG